MRERGLATKEEHIFQENDYYFFLGNIHSLVPSAGSVTPLALSIPLTHLFIFSLGLKIAK